MPYTGKMCIRDRYLAMGMKYDIPEFLGMCNTIFDIIEEKKIPSPECLIYLMLHPEYRSFEYEGRYEQPDFARFYEDSGILRARTCLLYTSPDHLPYVPEYNVY